MPLAGEPDRRSTFSDPKRARAPSKVEIHNDPRLPKSAVPIPEQQQRDAHVHEGEALQHVERYTWPGSVQQNRRQCGRNCTSNEGGGCKAANPDWVLVGSKDCQRQGSACDG